MLLITDPSNVINEGNWYGETALKLGFMIVRSHQMNVEVKTVKQQTRYLNQISKTKIK